MRSYLRFAGRLKRTASCRKTILYKLAKWLRTHKECGLPAVDFLSEIIERIVADKIVSADEMTELHHAIEKVLPGDIRKSTVESRKAIENAVKQKKKEVEDAVWEAAKQDANDQKEQESERRRLERVNRKPGFHSKVAGTTRQNDDGADRQKIIRDYVQPGMVLIHKREPDNPYDDWAISLWEILKEATAFFGEGVAVKLGWIIEDIANSLVRLP